VSRPCIELIAAVGPRWELGLDGGMPWGRIKGDLALFARVTKGKAVIMGRKTWESLPDAYRPLKGRLNVVMTRRPTGQVFADMPDGVFLSPSIEGALRDVRGASLPVQPEKAPRGIVIIGGGDIYRAALAADVVDVVHLSVIPRSDALLTAETNLDSLWPHDVAFPPLHPRGWALTPNGSSPRFAVRCEAEEGAPHGWRYAQLVRNPLEPALAQRSDGVPVFWGGGGGW